MQYFTSLCTIAYVLVTFAAQAADISQISPGAPAAALIAARPASQEDALVLTYKIEGGDAGTMTVDLPKDFTAKMQGSRTTIEDYALRRLITADDAAHTFQNNSLYGFVDFVVAETYNRRMQREVLGRLKVDQAAGMMDVFWVQSELHVMDAEDGTPSIDRRVSSDGTVRFFYKDAEVASYTPSNQPLTSDEIARFKRFLLFNASLHPVIVDDIAASGGLPERLTFSPPPMWKKPVVKWTLQSVNRMTIAYPLTPNSKPALPSVPSSVAGLIPVMMAAKSGQAPGRRSVEDYYAAIGKSFGQNPFQAAVLALELRLQFTDQAAECPNSQSCHSLREVFEAARRDPRTDVLMSALQPTKSTIQSAIKNLQEMKKDDLGRVLN